MKRSVCLLMGLAMFGSAVSLAEDRVWLIGGGNTLGNSQGQIEENVRWLQQLFSARGIEPRTYYTHGGADEVDVVYFAPEQERDPQLEPLLRVYGDGLAYARKTRRNSLVNVIGTTEKPHLIESLSQDFASVNSGDSVLLVYNGHGEIEPADTVENSLKLWGDTHLTITELDQLMDKITPTANVRFVLTQCFSGAFSKLIYENPRSRQLAEQNRCGFLAESDRRESEGCDLGTNQAEFRDYTTYFFAALQGETRLGETIPTESLDLDGDGRVSFREAHLYTLGAAHSGDLSRSTSEVFLEEWQPWYLRWSSQGPLPDNDYGRIAKQVAQNHDLPMSGAGLQDRRAQLKTQEAALIATQSATRDQVKTLQDQLQQKLAPLAQDLPGNWPASIHQFSQDQLASLRLTITEHPDYPRLRQAQTQQEQLQSQLLDLSRDIAQVDKVLRMQKLARLEASFARFASQDDKAARSRLLSCENGHIDRR